MSTKLFDQSAWADPQSEAVLAFLRQRSGIEESWDTDGSRYLAEPSVAQWHNCRERGYVISLRSRLSQRQINIAFFEHRNSDDICAIAWEQMTLNPPTIENMDTCGKIYKDKYDVSHRQSYGEVMEMADWIFAQLTEFWKTTKNEKHLLAVAMQKAGQS